MLIFSESRAMQEILSIASKFAKENQSPLGTGHILLALLANKRETAGHILKLRGITENTVRTQLRALGIEDERHSALVATKAQNFASPFINASPSALHLLAALASSVETHAF